MPSGEEATTPQADLPFLFDYSLPPPFEQWIYPIAQQEIDGGGSGTGTGVGTETTSQFNPSPTDQGLLSLAPTGANDPGGVSGQNYFTADPNEAAAYLQLLSSLQASEAFPGASQF